VAHELAHALAGVGRGHDRRFRTAEVDVVAMVVGADAARSLAESFDAFGLDRAERKWPSPWHLDGDGFRVLATPADGDEARRDLITRSRDTPAGPSVRGHR
jgi:hypothetical protein